MLAKLNSALQENIVQSEIGDIYTIGDNNNQKSIVIIKFISYLRKYSLFSNLENIKGTGIAITNDLGFEDRKHKKYLKKHLNKAREQHLEAKIKGNKLIINGGKYTVEKLKGLEEQISLGGIYKTNTEKLRITHKYFLRLVYKVYRTVPTEPILKELEIQNFWQLYCTSACKAGLHFRETPEAHFSNFTLTDLKRQYF
ncbi:hypothetical protein JTB14_011389 [Gonioctena quinquepunctata]|nr:hypothetical protein JTB14_011389 [Gonioctena quinquepunctata]